jgi:hypothetical protein
MTRTEDVICTYIGRLHRCRRAISCVSESGGVAGGSGNCQLQSRAGPGRSSANSLRIPLSTALVDRRYVDSSLVKFVTGAVPLGRLYGSSQENNIFLRAFVQVSDGPFEKGASILPHTSRRTSR